MVISYKIDVEKVAFKLEKTYYENLQLYDILSQADDYVNGENSPRARDYSDSI